MKLIIWHSSEAMADFIINNTNIKNYNFEKKILPESDASKPKLFHKVPDHLKKILYLDCPDIIVELDGNPIFSMEDSKEAGTGHNAFQRFARLAASAENKIPSFYLYPEAVVIKRGTSYKWDSLNPLIYKALHRLYDLYNIPSLLYYYPSYYREMKTANNDELAPLKNKGLKMNQDIINYTGCPEVNEEVSQLFENINELIKLVSEKGIVEGLSSFSKSLSVKNRYDQMSRDFHKKTDNDSVLSPLTSCIKVKTKSIINYINKLTDVDISNDSIISSREYSYIYKIDAKFRGDPYPGALAAIDYLECREGETFEDRKFNLIMAWGDVTINDDILNVSRTKDKQSVNEFVNSVKNCENKNMLTKTYDEINKEEIPRYYMQARYGSTFSKSKHIRVYSYFCDAILFHDGVMWRDG